MKKPRAPKQKIKKTVNPYRHSEEIVVDKPLYKKAFLTRPKFPKIRWSHHTKRLFWILFAIFIILTVVVYPILYPFIYQ